MTRDLSKAMFARCIGLGAWCFLCSAVMAQQASKPIDIVQACGVDQRVDYMALTKFGPWDDRNYKLTGEDLELLAPDEDELHIPIPAFFRVELRREMPHLRRSGPAQYPRSAVPLFERRHGGLMQNTRTVRDCLEAEPDDQRTKKKCSRGLT